MLLKKLTLTLLVLYSLVFHTYLQAQTHPSFLIEFEKQAKQIETSTHGRLGFAVLHIESGKQFSFHGNEHFPMASVYKFPIALQVLHMAEDKKIRLEDKFTVTDKELRPGHSPLATLVLKEGNSTLSLYELLELMLSQSDNTASDILLNIAGGPEAVNARMRKFGIENIRVSRSEALLALDFYGVTPIPAEDTWQLPFFEEWMKAVPAQQRRQAFDKFVNDPRDSATPDAMVRLLALTHEGKMLKPVSNKLLLGLMENTPTGPNRLKGLLPKGTPVAHKTGTTGSTEEINAGTNDVGILTLPDGKGHLAIAVFVKGSNQEADIREKAIAQTARMCYDYWTKPAKQ
jgi:beta-lactamase class A